MTKSGNSVVGNKWVSFLVVSVILLILVLPFAASAGINELTNIQIGELYIASLASSPEFATDGTMFAGTSNGILISTDKGQTWSRRGLLNKQVLSIAISSDFGQDNTLFVGTMVGVYKTTDRGLTWTLVNNGLPPNFYTGELVVATAPNYAQNQTVFFGTTNGLFGSTDGGSNWAPVNTGIINKYIYTIFASPNYEQDNTVFIGSRDGVYKSTDSGQTWVRNGLDNIIVYSLALTRNYAENNTIFVASGAGYVYKTTDGGQNWTAVNTFMGAYNDVAISPDYSNDDSVFVRVDRSILKTTDNGLSWQRIDGPSFLPTDIEVPLNYASDKTIYVASWGYGLFVCTLSDVTPPSTGLQITPSEPNGDNSWYKSMPVLSLNSNEAGNTFYQWDTMNDNNWTNYLTSFAALEGEHTLYYYSVDALGNSEAINSFSFKIDTQVPSSPVLSGSISGARQVSLNWSGSEDATSGVSGYKVYNASTDELMGQTTDTILSLDNLAPGATYNFYVKAIDVAGNNSDVSNTVTLSIPPEKIDTTIIYEGDVSGEYSDSANLMATLRDINGLPLSDKQVVFTLGNQEVISTTDNSGKAYAEVTINQNSGTKELVVGFGGDSGHNTSILNHSFDVLQETTSIVYSGDVITQKNQNEILKAQLSETDSSVGDLSGKTVVFTITNGTNTQAVTTTTDQNGLASTTAQITIPAGLYNVAASFAGDGYYIGSTSVATPYVIWEAIQGLNVNGGGWLLNNGKKSNFGFIAKYISNSNIPIGQLEYIDRNINANVHSEGFDWLVVTVDNVAVLEGIAKVNGQSGHTFRLIVSDNGTPGAGNDSFELQIDGLLFVSGMLSGGNIVIP